MNQSFTTRLSNVVGVSVTVVLILLPFHEFLTTWLGSNFGHLNEWRIWKEVIIFFLSIASIYLIHKTPTLRKWIKNDWLVRVIFVYVALTLIVGVFSYHSGKVNKIALADGLITDLRFPVFFIVTSIAAYNYKFLKEGWQKILLIPAVLVVLFGLVQLFLPIDFLRHFGYGPKTIPAYQTVDQKIQYYRIQSTMRGANPFGAYLVLIISACFINLKHRKLSKLTLAVGSTIALFFTYSRSAYLGLIASLISLYYLVRLNKTRRKQFLVICAISALVFSVFVITFRSNSVTENILFHTSGSSKSRLSSNAQRSTSLKNGLKDVIHQPLGRGPGTAGPASMHNNHPARIAENYYIQIAQETGWLGLLLFLAINILVAIKLWQRQKDPLASLLLATLVGISIINMISHAWADDTLSLLWWGLAGIMLSPAIIKTSKTK